MLERCLSRSQEERVAGGVGLAWERNSTGKNMYVVFGYMSSINIIDVLDAAGNQ
jgi:hypothetical protein